MREGRRSIVVALIVATAACTAAACGGKKSGGAEAGSHNGFVNVYVDPYIGGSGDATFYSHSLPSEDSVFPLNSCVDLSTVTMTYPSTVDVGPTVEAVSGSTTITMERTSPGSVTSYESATGVDGAPLNASYDVTIGGVALGSVHMPTYPDPVSMSGSTITWTPMGADDVLVAVSPTDGSSIWFCRTTDTGSYSLPANVTTAIPHGQIAINGSGMTSAPYAGGTVSISANVAQTTNVTY